MICVFMNAAISATPNSAKLSNIEKQLFGLEYQKDTELNRINRVEKYLYGKTSSSNIINRLKKISEDVGISQNENKIATNSSSDVKNKTSSAKSIPPAYEKEDPTVEYPIVDKIENQVFQRSFNGENIYARLDRLEKKVFTTTSSDNLNNRVNKLRLAVIDPNQNAYNTMEDTSDPLSSKYTDSLFDSDTTGAAAPIRKAKRNSNYEYRSPSSSKNEHISMELNAVEQNVLNQSFQSDSIGQRLDRLEAQIFKRSFDKDSDSTRLQRISAATTAQKTSRSYDNNKLMRNLNTGAQIGGFLLMILAMIL